MKTFKNFLIATFILAIFAAPAFAMEMAAGGAETLADFQRAYYGTKPMVAVAKFGQHKLLSLYPKPTLEVSRLRMDIRGEGTKPMVMSSRSSAVSFFRPSDRLGTKPLPLAKR